MCSPGSDRLAVARRMIGRPELSAIRWCTLMWSVQSIPRNTWISLTRSGSTRSTSLVIEVETPRSINRRTIAVVELGGACDEERSLGTQFAHGSLPEGSCPRSRPAPPVRRYRAPHRPGRLFAADRADAHWVSGPDCEVVEGGERFVNPGEGSSGVVLSGRDGEQPICAIGGKLVVGVDFVSDCAVLSESLFGIGPGLGQ